MSWAVRLGMLFLNTKQGKNLVKSLVSALAVLLLLPIILISGTQALAKNQEKTVTEAIEEVKGEKAIDNTLNYQLVLAIELSVHENKDNLQKHIIKEHIRDDYVKQVKVMVEVENDQQEVVEVEKEVSLFKTKIEIMAYIQEKYHLEASKITDIEMFIVMNNLLSVGVYTGEFLLPSKTGTVTCGWMCYSAHTGTDIGAPKGTEIVASAGGTVLYANNGCIEGDTSCGGGFGNHVVIAHNINGKEYVTIYGHMTETVVKEGQKVMAGLTVGYMGNTGRSEGVHLHFEIIQDVNHFPSKTERLTLGIDTETILQYPEKW